MFRFPKISAAPQIEMLAHVALPDDGDTALVRPLGMTVNTRIHPAGRPCTWHIEYGATTAYGASTTPRQLPGKLNAYFAESFASGLNGWQSGFGNANLSHQPGGFARHDHANAGADHNHVDGVGAVSLGPNKAMSHYGAALSSPPDPWVFNYTYLGGLRLDMRGAKITMSVRGNAYDGRGSIVCPWAQFDKDPLFIDGPSGDDGIHRANWANHANDSTAALATGNWETITLTLHSDATQWSFGGRDQNDINTREYKYAELDSGLGGLNVDPFLAMNVGVDDQDMPTGTVDFKDVLIEYRNNNLCAPQNGGTLVSSPAGSTGADRLVDGWRNGSGHEWQSAASPTLPQVFVYGFANPVDLECVLVANDAAGSAKEIEVFVSEDNQVTWEPLGTGSLPYNDLPAAHPYGPNHLFQVWTKTYNAAEPYHFEPIYPNPVTHIKVTINTAHAGANPPVVGLGSIEAYGQGADYETDDDWYHASRDVELPSGTHHYRVVAVTDQGTTHGPDQIIVVP